ncbi:MAG: hypothetical protein GF350_14505 [Chitinivibrionales bacterium]|nr:hypothetical protein [Chitinivibrionales bacterium]
MKRAGERLEPLPITSYLIAISFEGAQLTRGPSGELFFTLDHGHHKIGYMLTDFTGEKLIIRTFFFITNTSTSEGRMLNERLRVETYSKKYFGLDSLFVYISTDICSDPFFAAVLTECGCEDLVKYHQYFADSEFKDNTFSENLRKALALDDERCDREEIDDDYNRIEEQGVMGRCTERAEL